MPPVRAVDRALRILSCLGEGDLRLGDLAAKVKLHKATVTRLLASLARADMVTRDERGYYSLGSGIAVLSTRLLGRYRALVDSLRIPLMEVWQATRETVSVHVRVGFERVCVEELESSHMIAYRTGIGSRVPLHVGSGGKVLLAFLPADERKQLLRDLRLTALTDRTVTSRARLAAELATTRRLGYAVSVGERTLGSAAVSVPVFDSSQRVVAVVSVLGPDSRLSQAELRRCAEILRHKIRPLPTVIPLPVAMPSSKPLT